MKNATFLIKRNDVFDLIRSLKLFLKAHDKSKAKVSQYKMIQNPDLTVSLRLDKNDEKILQKMSR